MIGIGNGERCDSCRQRPAIRGHSDGVAVAVCGDVRYCLPCLSRDTEERLGRPEADTDPFMKGVKFDDDGNIIE